MNAVPVEDKAENLRRQLVKELVADGALTSDGWRAAFAEVPRHVFVPVFYRQAPGDQSAVDANTPDEWLEGVYRDQLLVVSPDVKSSSTVPSLMAVMLEALDPADGHRTLEIGTGTGYNAALLCHRLGDSHVASVDIAADLVQAAGENLAGLGYRPMLGIGDGADGWVGGALYDRIIATCAPNRVPQAWIDQTRAGGRIVTPIATGIAVIDFDADHRGTGRFLPGPAFFMPLRPAPTPADLGSQITEILSAVATARSTELDESFWFDSDFRFVQALAVPGLRFLTKLADSGIAIFTLPDGSWARIDQGTVSQGGPQKVWDLLEIAHQQWVELGRPSRERFSLAIRPEAQEVRLGGTDASWQLPELA
ncbi:protein-L-isoaspartate(D-aspartate) O-methyltransferase [Kribbella sp. NPDC056951]|uniref:protein-L-isoaspartate(D-aspartate) O-methyltransferase n=1 Tax=Kribbella sp. NPDC056951 TaxID=3345978 RepID=UPI00362EED85